MLNATSNNTPYHLQTLMQGKGLVFTKDEAGPLEGVINGENGTWTVHIGTDEHMLTLLNLHPVRVPHAHFETVTKVLNRMNSALKLGNWMLDEETRRIGFHVSIPLPTDELSAAEQALGTALLVSCHTFDDQLGRFVELMFSGKNTPGVNDWLRDQDELVSCGADRTRVDFN